MEPSNTISLLIIFFSIIAIAVLSMSESSFIAVNKYRIRALIEKGDKRAIAVMKILDEHDKLFSAVILSGNLFTILATSIGTVMAIDLMGQEQGVIAATVVMTFLTVLFGELTPKTLAVTHSEKVSLFLAKPVAFYIKLISPIVWVFSGLMRLFGAHNKSFSHYLTAEEIKDMISIGEKEGALEEDEKEMLERVFEFGDTEVSEVMVPRTDVVFITAISTVADAMALVSERGYSRYPVVGENVDEVLGVLYIKDILIRMARGGIDESTPVKELMRDPFFFPESKMVTELLDEMQKNNFHIAIIIDEYGGTDGLVTLEDIMEEIVGGLQDEFEALEAEKEVEVIDERTFVVLGQTDLDEVNELVGAEIESKDFHTIGGCVLGFFGRLPKVGEQVRYQNLRFLILDMEDRRISKVKITKL